MINHFNRLDIHNVQNGKLLWSPSMWLSQQLVIALDNSRGEPRNSPRLLRRLSNSLIDDYCCYHVTHCVDRIIFLSPLRYPIQRNGPISDRYRCRGSDRDIPNENIWVRNSWMLPRRKLCYLCSSLCHAQVCKYPILHAVMTNNYK